MTYQAKTGRKTRVKGVTTEGRQEDVKALYAELEEYKKTIDVAVILKQFATVLARFDGYSEDNALLVAMQRPNATDVDSRKAWIERGRIPIGKDTAIRIVRPGHRWFEEDPNDPSKKIEHVQYFVWKGLFDVATTVLPEEVEEWKKAHPDGKWDR